MLWFPDSLIIVRYYGIFLPFLIEASVDDDADVRQVKVPNCIQTHSHVSYTGLIETCFWSSAYSPFRGTHGGLCACSEFGCPFEYWGNVFLYPKCSGICDIACTDMSCIKKISILTIPFAWPNNLYIWE